MTRDSTEYNKALTRRWFEEVWNQGLDGTIDELFMPEGVGHGLGESDVTVRGPAALKLFINNFRKSISDLRIDIDDILAENDEVMVRGVLTGTHTGDGLGVPASGTPIRVALIVVIRFVGNQIAEVWNSWDQLGL